MDGKLGTFLNLALLFFPHKFSIALVICLIVSKKLLDIVISDFGSGHRICIAACNFATFVEHVI